MNDLVAEKGWTGGAGLNLAVKSGETYEQHCVYKIRLAAKEMEAT